jgi:hypothetical protein
VRRHPELLEERSDSDSDDPHPKARERKKKPGKSSSSKRKAESSPEPSAKRMKRSKDDVRGDRQTEIPQHPKKSQPLPRKARDLADRRIRGATKKELHAMGAA